MALADQARILKPGSNQEQSMVEMLKVFVNQCQMAEAYFFRYSIIGFLGEGIISLEQEKIKHIPELRYDIRSLPTIEAALLERKAKYYEGQEIFEKTSSNYVIDSTVRSFLVTPVFTGTTVHGFIYGINQETVCSPELLDHMTKFGEQAGKILCSFSISQSHTLLSTREWEVMREIAWGAATKEIAGRLDISEATVKQYVKQAVKKLGVSNRTHAVAELMRRGAIF
ncbi:response regulator transcription factor [Planococcus alpniumensis]|uniref:response regulator transcription factor n=1 Tax=Planococcus alpniumensis TaxID=2708345 RepID=UPI001B8AC909|nr:LuxR C-terminal-related transcriptional regulator [Planococcus sp. MSAK28401]